MVDMVVPRTELRATIARLLRILTKQDVPATETVGQAAVMDETGSVDTVPVADPEDAAVTTGAVETEILEPAEATPQKPSPSF